MDTLGHSEVVGMKASPNRKSSKNKNNKPPQSVKNHMIYGEKSETRNQNINGQAIPKKGMPLSM